MRVVCGFGDTIASFTPSSAFSSDDLPTFGRPTMARNAVLGVDDVFMVGSFLREIVKMEFV